MSVMSRTARRTTVAGIAALGLIGASATGASAATKTLTYSCVYPLIGAQPLSVAIDAALPASTTAGTPTGQFDVKAVATATGETPYGIELIGAKTIEGTATAGASVSGSGTTQNVKVPTTIAKYTPTAGAESLVLNATGKTPSLTLPSAGTATVKVTSLNLNITAKDAEGGAIVLGDATDSDKDPNTFDVPCTLDPATQDTTLATIAVK